MGIQGHSGEGHRLICEWVAAGPDRRGPRSRCLVQPLLLSLGPRLLEQRVVGPAQGNAARSRRAGLGPVDRPGGHAAVPSGLSSGTWRCFWDFGCGMMGDRGAHTLDAVVSALKLGPPDERRGHVLRQHAGGASALGDRHLPASRARPSLPPVKLTWYEGTRPPRPDDLEDGRQRARRRRVSSSRAAGARSWPASTAKARGSFRKRG